MRVIKQNDPENSLNIGTVIYHAGSNIAKIWSDFQNFSQADQEYFNQLLPEENLDFENASELIIEPSEEKQYFNRDSNEVQIRTQENVSIEVIQLLDSDQEAKQAFEVLAKKGVTPEQYKEVFLLHKPISTTKVRERQAKREALDNHVKNMAGGLLNKHRMNPKGRELDKNRLGRENFVVVKAAIDKKINDLVGKPIGQRSEFSRQELDMIEANLNNICNDVEKELFNA